MDEMKIDGDAIEFGLWTGEFGWEVMTWIPWCRKQAGAYKRVVVNCPRSTSYLYRDFATRLDLHDDPGRGLEYPKRYRVDGLYKCYGAAAGDYDVLIHARGIRRKVAINYRSWDQVAAELGPLNVACIGTDKDILIDGCDDLRGIGIEQLCGYMAGCSLVVGVSSGVMHLASLCGAAMVVWGDRRTYFGETLERRYRHTWNPFDVQVGWLDADDWQPDPTKILNEIERLL